METRIANVIQKQEARKKMHSLVTTMLHQEQLRIDNLNTAHNNLAADLRMRLQTINNLNSDPDSTFKSFTLRTLASCSSSDHLMKEKLKEYIELTEKIITMFKEMLQILEDENK